MELIAKLLTEAIQGESFAEKRYEAFARQANLENHPGIARLFSGLARAEAIHIANHLRALKKIDPAPLDIEVSAHIPVGRSPENIVTAIRGEQEEISGMYPSFIRQIKRRHGKEFVAKVALLSLHWALEAEKVHLGLLLLAQKNHAAGRDLAPDNFYLCGVCGNLVYSDTTPETICPVCGHDPHFYNKVPQ